jgi:hypothetical protein
MKKISNLFKLILFLGISLKLNAQSTVVVLDEETKVPIPYATIKYQDNLGTFTNEKGIFLLDKKFDRLMIKSIGYKELNFDLKDIKDTLLMSVEPIKLDPIVITPLAERSSLSKVNMKTNNEFHKCYFSNVGNEIAKLILGNSNSKKSYLTNIKIPTNSSILKVRTKDNTKAKEVNDAFCSVFQIQFYENENGLPGQLLNYDLTIIKITQKDDKYFQIDLSEKNIIVPKEGVFIGLLAIGRADENGNLLLENPYEEKLTQKGLIRIGLSIRPLFPMTEDFESNTTFIRYRFKIDGHETWSVFENYSFSSSTTKNHKALNLGIGYELKNY